MKSEVLKYWEQAIGSLQEARLLLRSNEPVEAKSKAWIAVSEGVLAIREIEVDLTQILSIAVDFLFYNNHNHMSARHVVKDAENTLMKIRKALPQEYFLPDIL